MLTCADFVALHGPFTKAATEKKSFCCISVSIQYRNPKAIPLLMRACHTFLEKAEIKRAIQWDPVGGSVPEDECLTCSFQTKIMISVVSRWAICTGYV